MKKSHSLLFYQVRNREEITQFHNKWTMGNTKKEGSVSTKDRIETKEPPLYKVLLHNDDYTTMEFVIAILENVFHKSNADATRIMLSVHHEGVGVAGLFSKEIAETKVSVVHELAQKNSFPLRCSLEIA